MPKDNDVQVPRTYTVKEASRLLRMGRNQTYEAIERGDIEAVRIGKRWLVVKSALDQKFPGVAGG